MVGWIVDNIILGWKKYRYRIADGIAIEHLRSRITDDNHYYVKSEGYIIGKIRFKGVKIEDFILVGNVSEKNKPKVNMKDVQLQLLSSPGMDEAIPSDPAKQYKVIGEWRTMVVPEPSDREDEEIFKKIENGSRRYYVLVVIVKADYERGMNRRYHMIVYLYSWNWRKRLGDLLI